MLGYVRAGWGEAGLEQLALRVRSEEAARVLRSSVQPSSWYPFGVFTSMLEAGDVAFPATESFARRQAVYGAKVDLRGIYRVFVRLAVPAHLVSRSAKVWQQYYSSGQLTVTDEQPTSVTFELVGFGAPHRLHCAAVLGWSEQAAALTGVKGVTGDHAQCRGEGGRRCIFHIAWK